MKALSNFLFYIGLFSMNTFRKTWKWMIGSSVIIGTLSQIHNPSLWYYCGPILGVYIASMYGEYIEHTAAVVKKNRANKYNEVIQGLKGREAEFYQALVYILDDEEVALGYLGRFESIAKKYENDAHYE